MVESGRRFVAAASADSPEGYAEASGPDLATRCTPNEAAATEKGDQQLLRLNDGWRLAHSLTSTSCLWCGCRITLRMDGGRQRRFCLPAHRTAYYSAARRLVDGLVRAGRLSVAALHASPATCTLVPGAFAGGAAGGVAKIARPRSASPIRVLWAGSI